MEIKNQDNPLYLDLAYLIKFNYSSDIPLSKAVDNIVNKARDLQSKNAMKKKGS